MEHVLQGILKVHCDPDNISMTVSDDQKHLKNADAVLYNLNEFGLYVQCEKCMHFFYICLSTWGTSKKHRVFISQQIIQGNCGCTYTKAQSTPHSSSMQREESVMVS